MYDTEDKFHLKTKNYNKRQNMTEIRNKTIQGLKLGETFTVQRTFTESDMLAFAEITRDYNPVHFDERFASSKKFAARICHGLLIASLITEIGGQIGWLASKMDFRFKKPVYFNDRIMCVLTITSIDEKNRAEAKAVFRNQHEDIVIEAELGGILPNQAERDILAQMVAEGDPTNKL
jgi:acyl dehydratase